MNIQKYIAKKTFLESATLANQLVTTLHKDKLDSLKAELLAKIDYAKKAMHFSQSKKECENIAEQASDLYLNLCFQEKLAFKSMSGKRTDLLPKRKEVKNNKSEKERHFLKGVNSEEELEGVTKEIKEKRNTVTVSPRQIHDYLKPNKENHRLQGMIAHPEYWTPPKFIEMARKTMGGIDLDPASNKKANKVVKAKRYFTKEDNGLKQKWFGRIWLNPPYSHKIINEFIHKLATERYEQAIVLVNNNTETLWGQELLDFGNAICFPKSRIKFWGSGGEHKSGALQGQIIVGIDVSQSLFKKHFKKSGVIYVRA